MCRKEKEGVCDGVYRMEREVECVVVCINRKERGKEEKVERIVCFS